MFTKRNYIPLMRSIISFLTLVLFVLSSAVSGQALVGNYEQDPAYPSTNKPFSAPFSVNATTDKFGAIIRHISTLYVDDVDENELVESAIVAMLEKLDPHSIYIPKEELQDMNAPLKGNFDGIGVRFQILKDTIMVVNPIPGGPSEKLGIRAGDKIVTIEGETVAGVGIRNSGVRDRLLGKKGTVVHVGVHRKGEKELLEFEITRDKIPLYSVDASYMVTDKIGYVKVNNFAQTTIREFSNAVIKLKQQGMESLVLDLQGNGGGYLNTAIDLADQFLEDGKLVVYTEGRAFPKYESHATSLGLFEKGDLVVLIDESSASASEIVSGALQDWDRGLLVGRRSFGKGLVQRQIDLPDSSAMRLTISRYFTPTGRSIQKPYDEGIEAYHREKYERYISGELMNEDSVHFPDSLKFKTKMTNRLVYGGGGIMPDVFVPIDTSYNSDYFSSLIRKGILNTFALDYVDKHRNIMVRKFKTFEQFDTGFDVDEVMEELIAYAEKEGLEKDKEDLKTSRYAIRIRLKASIASNLFDYESFYRVINDLNPALQEAVRILESGEIKEMNLVYNK